MPPLALLLLSSTLLLALSIATVWLWRDDRLVARRVRRLAGPARSARPSREGRGLSAGAMPASLAASRAGFDAPWVRFLPRADPLQTMLARSGRSITLRQFLGWVAGVGFGVAILLTLVTGNPWIGVSIGVAAGWFLPRMFVRRMARRRTAAFIKQFPDAIDLIIRALRAGLPLTEAISTIANECPNPIGQEFRRAAGALAISRSVDQALWEIERNIDSAELRFFIISVTTQLQTGGNLGETLANLADVLRQRSQMRMKVKAMSGEARASAYVLGSLPFIITLLMFFTNPAYITPLFTDPRGWLLLGVGAMMLGIGITIMVKLVQFEI